MESIIFRVILSTRHLLVAIYAGTLCDKHDVKNIQHALCLQRVFLRAAKLKPACECEPHCFGLAATLSSLSLLQKMPSSVKPACA